MGGTGSEAGVETGLHVAPVYVVAVGDDDENRLAEPVRPGAQRVHVAPGARRIGHEG